MPGFMHTFCVSCLQCSLRLHGSEPSHLWLQDTDAGPLLPRTMPAPAASPTQRALRFMRSRDGRLALLSMVLLVFQGTALSLTLRVSRCAPRC